MAILNIVLSLGVNGNVIKTQSEDFPIDGLNLAVLSTLRETIDSMLLQTVVEFLLDAPGSERSEAQIVVALGRILAEVLGPLDKYGWEDDGLFHISFGGQEVARTTVQAALLIALNQWCANKP